MLIRFLNVNSYLQQRTVIISWSYFYMSHLLSLCSNTHSVPTVNVKFTQLSVTSCAHLCVMVLLSVCA